MTRFAEICGVFIVLVTGNLVGGAIIVDFDDRQGGPATQDTGDPVASRFLVNDEYRDLGVLFDSGGGGIHISAAIGSAISDPNLASATAPGPVTGIGQFPVVAEFVQGSNPAIVDFVSIDLSPSSQATTMTAFDIEGLTVGVDTGVGPNTLQVSAIGINSISIEGVMAFDNFTFSEPVQVPEPASTALILLVSGTLSSRRLRGNDSTHGK